MQYRAVFLVREVEGAAGFGLVQSVAPEAIGEVQREIPLGVLRSAAATHVDAELLQADLHLLQDSDDVGATAARRGDQDRHHGAGSILAVGVDQDRKSTRL